MARYERFHYGDLRVPVEIHGTGRPLIFLPGLGVHPRYYREGLARLARQFTVFVPDLSFQTHDTLPEHADRYRELLEALADRYAPSACRVGHSYGGLLALLGSAPAVALSPLIPLDVGWTGKFGRAVRLQLREYLGLEGRRGAPWAWSIFRDYLGTAIRRPASLFPAVSETLHCLASAFRPTAPAAHIVVAEFDRLYRPDEYETFLARSLSTGIVVRRVPRGHAWPVTHPDLFEREVLHAVGSGRAA